MRHDKEGMRDILKINTDLVLWMKLSGIKKYL